VAQAFDLAGITDTVGCGRLSIFGLPNDDPGTDGTFPISLQVYVISTRHRRVPAAFQYAAVTLQPLTFVRTFPQLFPQNAQMGSRP
jgi:hypothetical protein